MSALFTVSFVGAQADALVTNFNAAGGAPIPMPTSDSRLCMDMLDFSASAATGVRLYLAPTAAAAAIDQVTIFDSATATVAGTAQYVRTGGLVEVNSTTRVPWTLRITTTGGDATVRLTWVIKPPGSC